MRTVATPNLKSDLGGSRLLAHTRLSNAVRARLFRLLFAKRFAAWGPGSLIVAPVAIQGAENIRLGAGVYVAAQTCLAAMQLTGDEAELVIGDGCKLGRFNHIFATRRVELGRKVLTANGVYISDNLHDYRDPGMAIMDQRLVQAAAVRIGDGAWIGHNACIFGASVGRNAVIGANSVVTRDIPDFCVAVGAPARIIKRFDGVSGRWRSTRADGVFSEGPEEQAHG